MAAQKRETGKNYIGLLHEETEEQRVADISAAAKHPHHGSHGRPDGRDVQPPQRSEVVTPEVVIPTPSRR
jgi:hypothetical protein